MELFRSARLHPASPLFTRIQQIPLLSLLSLFSLLQLTLPVYPADSPRSVALGLGMVIGFTQSLQVVECIAALVAPCLYVIHLFSYTDTAICFTAVTSFGDDCSFDEFGKRVARSFEQGQADFWQQLEFSTDHRILSANTDELVLSQLLAIET